MDHEKVKKIVYAMSKVPCISTPHLIAGIGQQMHEVASRMGMHV